MPMQVTFRIVGADARHLRLVQLELPLGAPRRPHIRGASPPRRPRADPTLVADVAVASFADADSALADAASNIENIEAEWSEKMNSFMHKNGQLRVELKSAQREAASAQQIALLEAVLALELALGVLEVERRVVQSESVIP